MSRSLKFKGRVGPRPYDAVISVHGGVTGMRCGELLLTRADLDELEQVVRMLKGELK